MIRTKETFFEHISTKDPKTVKQYGFRIAKFEQYCIEKHGRAEMIDILKKDWPDILQLYINWLSKDFQPSSVRSYFASIRKYLHYRGVRITKDDVDNELEQPKIHDIELHPLSLDEIRQILKQMRYRDKALFMFQISTGVRIGEAIQLRKRDFVFGKERIAVKIPARIAKMHKGRTTFVSKEAAIMLTSILKQRNDNDLVFGTSENSQDAKVVKSNLLRRHLELHGLDDRYDDSDRHKISTHSFRAYFITKASRSDENIAKKLTGQKGYLLQYDRLTEDELLEEYLKFEDNLLIFDDAKKDAKIKKLEEANRRIVNLEQDNKDKDIRLSRLEDAMLSQKHLKNI